MQTLSGEILIVHGGGLTPAQELPEKAVYRMDTAITGWRQGIAPHMAVSGGHSFLLRNVPDLSEAAVMKRYGVKGGVPEGSILTEESSLETVGNALFTKIDIVVPRGWENLVVVTSRSHLPRTLEVFSHVYGRDFNVQGMPAPERITAKERVWELLGSTLVKEILKGTRPGDHEAIQERLFDLVPGYADGSFSHLAHKLVTGFFRR